MLDLSMHQYNSQLLALIIGISLCWIPDHIKAQPSGEVMDFNGLIVDETITKPGHDFCEIFYQKWTLINNEQFINLVIKEQTGRFRGGFIMVFMQDEMIYKALLPFRYDDIEILADKAVRDINQILYQKAFIDHQLDYY